MEVHPEAPARAPFALGQCSWLGFDLDHTLARYNLATFLPFVYSITVRQLVEIQGYERELLDLPYRSELCKKGVVIDKRHGTLVKLDSAARVVRACRGWHWLSESEVRQFYPDGQVEGFTGHSGDRFYIVHTYFDLPVLIAYAAVVHLRGDGAGLAEGASVRIAEDLVHSLDYNYGSWDRGFYYEQFCARISTYAFVGTEVRRWLETMRAEGFRLYLITNSNAHYAQVLLEFTLGADWRELFDIAIVYGRKPSFWAGDSAFAEIHYDESKRDAKGAATVSRRVMSTATLSPGFVYEGGCLRELLRGMRTWPGAADVEPVVAYFGDHLAYDCGAARALGLRAVGIVEEIETDVHPETVPPTEWGCFFSFGGHGERVALPEVTGATGSTYWKLFMDGAVDAAIGSVASLCGLHRDTVLNVGSVWTGAAASSTAAAAASVADQQ